MSAQHESHSEHTSSKSKSAEPNKIDITQWLDRFLNSLRKWWWAVLILVIGFSVYNYTHVNKYYVPNFQAEATLTISATSEGQAFANSNYSNISTTQEMVDVFSGIVQSGILDSRIAEYMKLDHVPGSYSVECITNTNMLVVKANATDGETAYELLQAVIAVYPDIAQFIIGQTTAVLLDDSGVPVDTGMEYKTRGSIRSGALRGLLLGMVLLVLDMILSRRIRYESDFTSLLHVHCLGQLPEIKTKKRRKNKAKEISILDNSATGTYLEATRYLRSRVERSLDQNHEKTFLVTSSVPSEGKTTVAVNLAVSFARKGKSVMLIDCDLRHPSVQNRLNLEGEYPGLIKVLRCECSLDDALYKVQGMDLSILCGASESSDQIEILGQSAMKQLIEEAEKRAEIVILDTSPSAMLADALTLAKNVKTALYVVRCEYAKVRHILDGIEELQDSGVRLMGCVLNYSVGASGKSYGYSKYGYGKNYGYGRYGYGYGYGYGQSRRSGRRRKEEQLAEENRQSALAESAASEPVYTEPVYSEPEAVEPAYMQPVYTEPDYTEPVYTEPVYTEPADTEPAYSEPEAVEPEYTEPVYSEPKAAEPEYTEPEETQPVKEEQESRVDEQTILMIHHQIADYEEKIRLVTRYQQLRPVYLEGRSLSGSDRRIFLAKHTEEIQEYSAIVAALKEQFGNSKIPSVSKMKDAVDKLKDMV